MVCLLYQNYLCLASAGRADQIYTIQLCVELASLKVEEVDNGRGEHSIPLVNDNGKPRELTRSYARLAMSYGALLLESCL